MNLAVFSFSWISIVLLAQVGGLAQGLILDQQAYELMYTAPNVNREFTSLPGVVSLKKYCPEPVKQFIPACVGYALAYAASIRRNIKEEVVDQQQKKKKFFAPLFIYNQAIPSKEGCNLGTSFNDAFDVAQNQGLDEYLYWESRNCRDLPEASELARAQLHRLSGKEAIKGSNDASLLFNIKTQLHSKNPVLAGLRLDGIAFRNLNSTGMTASALAYHPTQSKDSLLHAVTIIGYDDDAAHFECINSYGKNWGEMGFFKIKYPDFLAAYKECYFITGENYKANANDLPGFVQTLKDQNPSTETNALGGSFELVLQGFGVLKPQLATLSTRRIDVAALDSIGHYHYERALRNGESVQFVFGSQSPAYIYLLNRGTSGEVQMLFPQVGNTKYSAYFPYQQAFTTFPDQDQVVVLDGASGIEYLYLLLSNVPLDMEQVLSRLNQAEKPQLHLSNLKTAIHPHALATGQELLLDPSRISVNATKTGDFVVPIVISIPHL